MLLALAPRFSTDPQFLPWFRAPLTLIRDSSRDEGPASAERGDLSYMILYACDRRRRTRAHIHIVSQTGVGGWALINMKKVGATPLIQKSLSYGLKWCEVAEMRKTRGKTMEKAKNHVKNAHKIVSSGLRSRRTTGGFVIVYTLLTHNLILDRIEQYYITNKLTKYDFCGFKYLP